MSEENIYGSITGQDQAMQSCCIAIGTCYTNILVIQTILGPLGKLGSIVINFVCVKFSLYSVALIDITCYRFSTCNAVIFVILYISAIS